MTTEAWRTLQAMYGEATSQLTVAGDTGSVDLAGLVAHRLLGVVSSTSTLGTYLRASEVPSHRPTNDESVAIAAAAALTMHVATVLQEMVRSCGPVFDGIAARPHLGRLKTARAIVDETYQQWAVRQT